MARGPRPTRACPLASLELELGRQSAIAIKRVCRLRNQPCLGIGLRLEAFKHYRALRVQIRSAEREIDVELCSAALQPRCLRLRRSLCIGLAAVDFARARRPTLSVAGDLDRLALRAGLIAPAHLDVSAIRPTDALCAAMNEGPAEPRSRSVLSQRRWRRMPDRSSEF